MSASHSEPGSSDAAETPAKIRLKPSRNQKQRSKLKQLPDPAAAAEPAPAPAPPPPPPAATHSLPPQALRTMRLKRSGQMHEDLGAQPPADRKKEDEY
ncbi:MAG TPA: hypothetical protein VF551_01605 [Chthoniobacterales bacterium]